ncbi:hypothetical protein Droror1_Dr00020550 [Drosera rotundifolia]
MAASTGIWWWLCVAAREKDDMKLREERNVRKKAHRPKLPRAAEPPCRLHPLLFELLVAVRIAPSRSNSGKQRPAKVDNGGAMRKLQGVAASRGDDGARSTVRRARRWRRRQGSDGSCA